MLEETTLHKRIDELEEIVETLKKRISVLEQRTIFISATQPPQVTGPIDWTPKPHPYNIRNSNRSSDG